MTTVVIIGCGDIGERVGQLWLQQGATVTGSTRDAERARQLQAAGIVPLIIDLNRPADNNISLQDSVVYYFVPPFSEQNDTDDSRLRNFLTAAAGIPRCVVYISTTAVYGDCRGQWVTEQTAVNPQNSRGRMRLAAENIWRQWHRQHVVPLTVLRVAGIYGPGRLPLQQLRDRRPVLLESDAPYSNRIHADDLAQICFQAAGRAQGFQLYNVCDGYPVTSTQYYFAVADLLGWPRPPTVTWSEAQQVLSAQQLDFLQASRRIDNRQLLDKLGVTLRYPDLESGLRASLETATR